MAKVKKYHITALSVFSCFGVVCLHTNGFWNFTKSLNWLACNLVECFFYFAVPVFLMISGATLIDYRKRYSTGEYFKKRLLKTLIPFIFWSIFAIFFNFYIFGPESVSFKAFDIINSVINTQYINVYYFFFILFSVYISIPVLSLIPESSRKSGFLYIIITAFCINSLIPFVLSLTDGKIVPNSNFSFLACSGYLIFPVIGYYLEHYELSKKSKLLIFIFGFLGFAFHYGGTAYLSWKTGMIDQYFKGYLSIFCILYSSAIYLLFKLFPFEKLPGFIMKTVDFFSGQTFGVYLLHIFVLIIVTQKMHIDPTNPILRIVFALIIFVFVSLITKIMQKIPIVKWIVP